jgi:hypothetical protein
MPFKPLPAKLLKKKSSDPETDSESSVDERGNVKNLIDYDYEESTLSSVESELPPRKAKKKAEKRIRKAIRDT